MNERIEKLAEQAGAEEIGVDLYGGEFIGAIRSDFLEKFAELIVKECYEICKGNLIEKGFGLSTEQDLSYNEGVMDCAIMVKHHFGDE